ncbi:MAG: hypothetical protein ACXVEV_10325 [Nocardioidaceae bacterium]
MLGSSGRRCRAQRAADAAAVGSGNQPSDTTSWQASLEGDPVRLVE